MRSWVSVCHNFVPVIFTLLRLYSPFFVFFLFHFQGKKSKKKPKQAAKETKIVTADGKEPEEGDVN